MAKKSEIAAAGIATLAALAVAGCAVVGQPLSDNTANETLAEEFVRLALDRSGSVNKANAVRKWTAPVTVKVAGAASPTLTDWTRQRLATLAADTGHPVSMAEQGASNFEVVFAPREDYPQWMESFAPGQGLKLNPMALNNCLFVIDVEAGVINRAIVLIPPNETETKTRHCLAEETAQAMGIVGDSMWVGDTLFDDLAGGVELTPKDKLFLKVLYHPAVKPGMSVREARAAALTALAELRPGPPPASTGPAAPTAPASR